MAASSVAASASGVSPATGPEVDSGPQPPPEPEPELVPPIVPAPVPVPALWRLPASLRPLPFPSFQWPLDCRTHACQYQSHTCLRCLRKTGVLLESRYAARKGCSEEKTLTKRKWTGDASVLCDLTSDVLDCSLSVAVDAERIDLGATLGGKAERYG